MTLDAVVSRSTPEVRLLLGEATHTVREVQAITQRVIADLSPPGLYELGLEPALSFQTHSRTSAQCGQAFRRAIGDRRRHANAQ